MLRWGCIAVALVGASIALGEELPGGDWDSPIGKIHVEKSGDGWVGKLVSADATSCLKGSVGAPVFKGQLIDDSFTGEVMLCLEGPECVATQSWLNVLMLVDAKSAQLGGAVEKGNSGCHAKLPHGAAFFLHRHRSAPAHPPLAVDPSKEAAARSLLAEGAQLMDDGRFEVARERFQKSLGVAPLPEAYNGIGVTYYARKQYDEALAAYKQALVLDSGFGDAYYNIACIYSLTHRPDAAFRYLRLAVRNGYKDLGEIDKDGDLDPLRSDPRFKDLRKRYTPGG